MSYGDPIAEEIIYKRYSVFISKKIRDFHMYHEYDDVFQESLILLSKTIDKYIDSEVPFYSFFMKCLVNMLSTRSVRNKREKLVVFDDRFLLNESETMDYELPDYSIFNGLTIQEKLAINLVCIKKWTYKKVEKEYGYSKPQLSYLLRKAKIKIQKNMNKN